MTMANKQGQFQIIILETEQQSNSHSLPGPWGLGITSSVQTESFSPLNGVSIKILARPNEPAVDPDTLKASR